MSVEERVIKQNMSQTYYNKHKDVIDRVIFLTKREMNKRIDDRISHIKRKIEVYKVTNPSEISNHIIAVLEIEIEKLKSLKDKTSSDSSSQDSKEGGRE